MIGSTPRSTMSAELVGAEAAAMSARYLRHYMVDLGLIDPQQPDTVCLKTDSKCVSTKTTTLRVPADKVLIPNCLRLHDAVTAGQLSIAHIPGEYNIADPLTKIKNITQTKKRLIQALDTGTISFPLEMSKEAAKSHLRTLMLIGMD